MEVEILKAGYATLETTIESSPLSPGTRAQLAEHTALTGA